MRRRPASLSGRSGLVPGHPSGGESRSTASTRSSMAFHILGPLVPMPCLMLEVASAVGSFVVPGALCLSGSHRLRPSRVVRPSCRRFRLRRRSPSHDLYRRSAHPGLIHTPRAGSVRCPAGPSQGWLFAFSGWGGITVMVGDTPWGIAERHLGGGLRWRDIWNLNRGVTQPDGRAWVTGDLIHPGWRLRLPTDAVDAGPPAAPAATCLPSPGRPTSPEPSTKSRASSSADTHERPSERRGADTAMSPWPRKVLVSGLS